MSFNTFCNICFIKKNIIKLCGEENERIINILVSFTSSPDAVNGIVYLCTNCCDKLEEFDKFRELLLTNFVRFRYLYNEHKKQLEIRNAPDIETLLKAFVDVNVDRASGTPLIENYEIAQTLRNNITSDADITCKESDGETFKIDLENFIHNDLMHTDTSLNLKNEIQAYHVKNENDLFKEDQETIDTIVKNEPNPDRFDESQDPVVSDCFGNVSPSRGSADGHDSDASFNPEDCVSDDTTEKGAARKSRKKIKKKLVCNVCEKRCLFKSELKKHMRIHTDERPFHCDVCKKGFKDKLYLKQHKLLHTDEKPFECEECGKGFRQRIHLLNHKPTHTRKRPFPCDQCEKSFATDSGLALHKRGHTGEKLHMCDECGLGFRVRSHLNDHKRTHTGEKPYSCDVCQKSFARNSSLILHKHIHSEEKRYKCDECGSGFSQKSNLENHQRRHNGKRPFRCDECGKTYIQRSSLVVHQRTHITKTAYRCDCSAGLAHLESDINLYEQARDR